MVILIMAVMAGLLIPNFQPNIPLRLQSTAELVAADVALVRSLAAANASTYEITFDPTGNQYYFEHTGVNTALDELPAAEVAKLLERLARKEGEKRALRREEREKKSAPVERDW